MRYGAVTFIWTRPLRTEDVPLVRRVAGLGFDAIEIAVDDPRLLDAAALRRELEQAGITASLMPFGTPEHDVASDDEDVRRRGVDHLTHCVDLAAAAGATLVAGPIQEAVGHLRHLDTAGRDDEFSRAADGLREVADHAADRGLSLAFEPLNRFEADLVNTVERGLELCEAIGRDNVGLVLDTFHLNIEEKSLGDAIRRVGPRLRAFHASENDRGIAGSGQVDWSEARDALADIGYDGVVSVESFAPELAALSAQWRPFFDDPDEFARDGLAHLRATFG
jgi:D-psicose/D-tagatose/L-ribulose 3-epimerase